MTHMSPKEALEKLVAGNARYIKDHLLHQCHTERREAVSSRQEPYAIILGCSDSRVPPEIIFDQGVGDLFVVRVAGNVVGEVSLCSIEFATKYLHSSLIFVLAHERCGAVTAVYKGDTTDIEPLSNLIDPVIKECKKECQNASSDELLDRCIRSNAKNVANNIRTSPLIARYIKENKIDVVAGYYDLYTGKVEILE
jgi:carbonic anhydrase